MTKPLLTLSALALFAGGMMSGRLLFPVTQKSDPEASSGSTRTITKRTSASRELSDKLDTIAALPLGADQQLQLVSALRALVDQDPGKVLELIEGVCDPRERFQLQTIAARELINQSPDEALRWLESQPGGSLRYGASDTMFHQVVDFTPSPSTSHYQAGSSHIFPKRQSLTLSPTS